MEFRRVHFRSLVSYYRNAGVEVDHEQIIVTTGGSEAILFGFMACLDAGDEVLSPEPLYANYIGFETEANVVVKTITSTIETGFAMPSIDAFEKEIEKASFGERVCK